MNNAKDLLVLLALSREMRVACECDDWPQVTVLEQQRAPLLKQFFDENELQTACSATRSNLEALLAINQTIQNKSETARQDLLCQLGNLKRINKVVDAYSVD